MSGNKQRKVRQKRKARRARWDFQASKILIAVKPETLQDSYTCLTLLGIPPSKTNREQLRQALRRAGVKSDLYNQLAERIFRHGGRQAGKTLYATNGPWIQGSFPNLEARIAAEAEHGVRYEK